MNQEPLKDKEMSKFDRFCFFILANEDVSTARKEELIREIITEKVEWFKDELERYVEHNDGWGNISRGCIISLLHKAFEDVTKKPRVN